MSPARSRKQQRFMGLELARARAGKKTRTGMSKAKLRKMASVPRGKTFKSLPVRVKKKASRRKKR